MSRWGRVTLLLENQGRRYRRMITIQLKKGEYLVREGEPMKALFIVLRGTVGLRTEYSEVLLGSGSVLGLVAGNASAYVCDYIAAEDALVASYKYETPDDFLGIFQEQPKYSYAFLHAAVTQCKTIYEKYSALEQRAKAVSDFVTKQCSEYELDCSQSGFEVKEVAVADLQQMNLPEPIRGWELGYYKELMQQEEKILVQLFSMKMKKQQHIYQILHSLLLMQILELIMR